jgi:hypothetical protein
MTPRKDDSDQRKTLMATLERRGGEDSSSDGLARAVDASPVMCGDQECNWPVMSHIIAGELKSLRRLSESTNGMVSDIKDRIPPLELKVNLGQWILGVAATIVILPLVATLVWAFVKKGS